MFRELRNRRFRKKLKKLVLFHRWLDHYMIENLKWSKAKRKRFWNDFIKSPEARDSNYRRLYFKIL